MATMINNTASQTGANAGIIPTNPFLKFGSSSVGSAGPTTSQVGSGLISLFGPLTGNQSTTPFAGGGTTAPSPVGSLATSQGTPNAITPTVAQADTKNSNGNAGAINPPSATSTPQGNSGLLKLPSAAAPEGMSYNAFGQLVPTASLATTGGGSQPNLNQGNNPNQATGFTFPNAVGTLAQTASQPSAAFTQAQQTAQQALQGLQESQSNEANSLANNSSNPIPIEFQQGRGQILTNQYLGQQNSLANEYQGAVGLENAATGQQGTQQSGLAGAAGLSMPQSANALGTYSPVTGEYNQYGGGVGGAQAAGQVQGQIGIGQNVAQLNSSLGGAQVVGNNLNDLITQNNINPTGLTYANGALQFGANAMSNPAYQKFAGQINDFIASLAPILGAGGNVTDMKTQMSSQVVNALQSGSTIKDVVSYFLDQAKQKIQGLQQGGGVGTSNTNGSTNTNSNPYGW